MEFRLLGPLEAFEHGREIPLGGPRQRAVLAHLLLRANTVVSADRLIDEVWGDEAPETARSTLHSYVSRLRQVVGNGARIEGRPPGYLLHIDPTRIDAVRFENLVHEARRLLGGDPEAALEQLDEGLRLWRGSPLADLDDELSLRPEIARLQELRLEAVEDLGAARLALGRQDEVVAELESLVKEHPLRERLWAHLMLALYRAGRQADALDAYQRVRRLLRDELGLEPSPELQELQGSILRHDPALEPEAQRLRGYSLLEEIGSGSFGIVHRALQPHVGREVAVKVISPSLANDPRFVRRFEAEAQLVARLEHPRIVPLYDYWREPRGAYLVMRLLRGGSLRGKLDDAGPLEPERAVALVSQVAAGLAVAHRQGIVHRDVKPANILLDEDGDAYVSDFGIATEVASEMTPPSPTTAAYLSPEQARGEPVTARTDVYSLGVVLREAVGGARASEPLGALIERATAEDPAERYPDAEALAEALAGLRAGAAAVRFAIPTRNPYKGLRPFAEADAADFFGRETLVQSLVGRLRDGATFLALVGASGSGKSSAVRAGLFPALRRNAVPGSSDWFVAEMSPGADPLEELEEALRRVAVDSPPTLTAERGSDLLLFVDQFEELFTLVKDGARRDRFLGLLADAAENPDNHARVIVALRADFYDRPLEHPALASLLRSGVETVVPPSPEELERAVANPAAQVGVACEPGLVGELAADVSGQAGALPLLQYALTELFERGRDGVMSLAAYRELEGVGGAVARRAEELYEEAGERGREATRQLLLRLVAVGEHSTEARHRVSRAELASLDVDQAALEEVIAAFGSHRLLSFDRDPHTRAPTVELAHEALLRAWGRLGGWLEEARGDVQMRARLAAAASEWDAAGRDPSFLLTGSRLDVFDAWARAAPVALARLERKYLHTSRELREAARAAEEARLAQEAALERRSRRRLRALVAVLALAAAAAAGLSIFALDQRGDARAEAARAEEQARVATARELAAAVAATVDDDPELALLLALEAVETTGDPGGPVLREAEEALRAAVHASRVVRSIPGVSATALAPDGSRVATARQDGSVTVWSTASGVELLGLPVQAAGVRTIAFGPDGMRILTVGEDGEVRVWDASTGEETRTFAADGGAALDPRARLLAVKNETTASVHEAETGRLLASLRVRGDPVALNGDGSLLALAADGVRVVRTSDGSEVLRADAEVVSDAAFSPDGSLLAVVGIDVEVWDVRTRTRTYVVEEGHPITTSVEFSRDGGWLATAAHDGAARIREAQTGRELLRLASRGTEIDSAGFSADGKLLAAAGKSGRATVWELTPEGRGELLTIPAISTDPVYFSPVFSRDGRLLAGATNPEVAQVWNAETGRPSATLRGHAAPVTDASFTEEGRQLVTTSFDGSAKLWDLETEAEIRSFAGHSAPVWGIAFDPRGSSFATASEDHTVRVWDLETGRTRLVIRHDDQVYDVDYSSDGSLLATSGVGGALIWDARTGDELRRLVGHDGNVVQIAFAPDGRRIATAGFDGTARLWDALTGQQLAQFSRHAGIVIDVDVSPDGSRIATASFDGTTRLWNPRTGRELLTLTEEEAPGRLAFDPDGSRLVVAAGKGTVRVYAVRIGDLVELARQRVTRGFTAEECRQYLHRESCAPQSR